MTQDEAYLYVRDALRDNADEYSVLDVEDGIALVSDSDAWIITVQPATVKVTAA